MALLSHKCLTELLCFDRMGLLLHTVFTSMTKGTSPAVATDLKKGSDKSFRTLWKNAVWAYKIMFSLSKRDTSLLFFTAIIVSLMPIAQAYLGARLIDEIISISKSGLTSIYDLDLTSPIIVVLLLSVLSTILSRFFRRLNQYIGERFDYLYFEMFNMDLLTRISKLDIIQFEDPKVSNDIKKAQENFYKIYVFTLNSVDFFIQLVTTVTSGIISITISPIIAGLIVLLSIPNNIIYAKYIKRIWAFYNQNTEKRRKFWWISGSLTSEREMPEHKITNSHQYISVLSTKLKKELAIAGIQIRKSRFLGSITSTLISSLTYIVAPLYLVSLILKGQITVGQFTFYEGRFLDFSGTLDQMIGKILELTDAASYLTYVRSIYDVEPAIKSGHIKIAEIKPPKIEFRNVSFKYPRSDKHALKSINITIDPSEEIAIVGENGAGKTTFIKLLLRFYEPTSGQILIDGTPIEELHLDTYHNLFGALFQEYNTYDALTVKDNITIGDYKSHANMKNIRNAARQADAQQYIEKLDFKYNTKLAKQFTGGTNLSTGQWQKLALARMFYRDRPVLLLDEPTASIDAVAEYNIFKRIYNFTQNKTVIIISHRFSTVRNAKRIYVLHQGELVEQGSHEELMKKKGRYAKAFNLQAKGYTKC